MYICTKVLHFQKRNWTRIRSELRVHRTPTCAIPTCITIPLSSNSEVARVGALTQTVAYIRISSISNYIPLDLVSNIYTYTSFPLPFLIKAHIFIN